MESIWLFALLGLAVVVTVTAVLVLWMQLRQAHQELNEQESALRQALEDKARAEEQAKRTRELEERLAELQESRTKLAIEVAELKRSEALNQEKLDWIERAQHLLRETFQALANEALRGNTGDFLRLVQAQVEQLLSQARGDWATHKAEMLQLLDPINRALKTLDAQVRELEQKREGAYQGLQEQLRQLAQAHTQLQTTTTTLSQALRSHSVRGRWGEYQLRRVVEIAGMTPHVDFEEQVSSETKQRVDMIIHMPNQSLLPVDAKTPMDAYLEAMSITDEQERTRKLKDHARAMRSHVNDLGQRRYSEQFAQTPDLVIMFIPIEACLSAAFEHDPKLLEFAFEQRVLIATPTTLLALLKAIAYGWQQHRLSEEASRVAQLGSDLYRELVDFSECLSKLAKELDDSVKAYNKAAETFKSKLVPMAESLGTLGSAAAKLKSLPSVRHTQQMLSRSQDELDE